MGDILHRLRRLYEGRGNQWVHDRWTQFIKLTRDHGSARRELFRVKRRKAMPSGEHRIGRLLCSRHVHLPAMNAGGNDVTGGKNLVELFARVLFRCEQRLQVIADASTNPFRSGVAGGAHAVVQLLLTHSQLVRKYVVFRAPGRRLANLRQAFRAVEKDAVQRVIVFGRNRIVFVVVAASTTDCEPQHSATDHVDTVVDDVMRDAQKSATEREVAHRGQGAAVVRSRLIGGQLHH